MSTLFLLLVFYVLSSGPVYKAVQAFDLPGDLLRAYYPLTWISETEWGSIVKPVLEYYIEDVWKVDPKKRAQR